ncbi:MAG: cytochrome c3 family protein [Deltaproteobacteria bacterium]|nr:cytochrome c3 family protein [Deltaproteobacteria bacterium]
MDSDERWFVLEEKTGEETRRPEARKGYRWFWAAVLALVAMVYLYFYYPRQTLGPAQPIYFSHRVHAGVKAIPCRFCHPFVERGSRAGIPPMEKCFFCHDTIIPTHPQIVKEKEHFKQKKPVPWVRVFYVPDFVFFNHRPHILWAKLDCSECHGDVKSMDRLPRVNFQMGFCIGCHRKMGAQTDCWLACHR